MIEVFAASAVLVSALMQGAVPPVRSLDKGAISSVSAARQVTVREGGEWASLWKTHAPDRPAPAIDFTKEMVVGIFLGTRPTAGYAVEIVGYSGSGNDLVVQYRETAPSRDAITAQVIVSPYHLAAVPRRTGMVTFQKVQR